MKKRYQANRVYLVRWDDGITKAGYTSERRWRTFELRGARVLAIWDFPNSASAFRCETAIDAYLWTWPLAWASKADVDRRLGTGKGGYLECHRVPEDMPDSCLVAMLASIAQPLLGVQCTDGLGRTGLTEKHAQPAEDRSGRNAHEIRAEVDDLWLAQWTPSRGLPQPDRLREIARDSASFEDTSAKEALNGIVKGLAE